MTEIDPLGVVYLILSKKEQVTAKALADFRYLISAKFHDKGFYCPFHRDMIWSTGESDPYVMYYNKGVIHRKIFADLEYMKTMAGYYLQDIPEEITKLIEEV